MVDGVRIDALPATVLGSFDHEFAAMKDGLTVKLKVDLIRRLIAEIYDPLNVGADAFNRAFHHGIEIAPDNAIILADPVDPTKRLRFDAGAVAAGATRVFGLPNYDGVLATLAGIETLTNKTLASPAVTGGTFDGYKLAEVLVASGNLTGANVDINLAAFLSAGYSRFRLHWRQWQSTSNNDILLCRVSTNGGASFLASGVYAAQGLFAQSSSPTTASASPGDAAGFNLTSQVGNAASGHSAGYADIDIYSTLVDIRSFAHGVNGTPSHVIFLNAGHAAAAGVNAIRLAALGGANHNSGNYSLYALRNS